jgi:hypothetical protein
VTPDDVGATQGRELDGLDAVDVHGDAADVAEQLGPSAIGREVDVLVGVGAGAIEHEGIFAAPSTMSLPSPGFQMNRSLPSPREATSLPTPPVMTSLPSPPISTSAPRLPMMVSAPPSPSIVSLI